MTGKGRGEGGIAFLNLLRIKNIAPKNFKLFLTWLGTLNPRFSRMLKYNFFIL